MEFPNKQPGQPVVVHADKPKVQAVVTGVVQVPRPVTRRFFDFVFAESPKAIGTKIGHDIIVPRAKMALEEAVGSFIKGMLWGNTGSPMSSIVQGTVLRGGTNLYHQVGNPSPALAAAQANQERSSHGQYSDLVSPTMAHAEALLAGMWDLFNQYRVVTVSDQFELASMTPPDWGGRYGWMSLEGARISKSREGYVLELPRPTLI